MAPIPVPTGIRHAKRILDKLEQFGNDVKGVGETVVDGGKNVVDAGKDAAQMLDQVKDAVKLYEDLKAKAVYYYDIYLTYRPYILAALITLLIIVALLWLWRLYQCFKFWVNCCCVPLWLGWRLARSSTPCFRWCGVQLIKTERCIPGLERARETARMRGLADFDGCDSTYLLRGCGAQKIDKDPDKAREQRLTWRIAQALPACVEGGCLPASWAEKDMESHPMRVDNLAEEDRFTSRQALADYAPEIRRRLTESIYKGEKLPRAYHAKALFVKFAGKLDKSARRQYARARSASGADTSERGRSRKRTGSVDEKSGSSSKDKRQDRSD